MPRFSSRPSALRHALALIGLASANLALASGFDGLYLQGGINNGSTKTKIESDAATIPSGTSSADNATGAEIAFGYSQSFGTFNMAYGLWYLAGERLAGAYSYNNGTAVSVQYKTTSSMGISLEPGINLSKDSLLYSKFSYAETRADSDTTIAGLGVGSNNIFHGYGFGLGFKHKFGQDSYGYVEANTYDYRRNKDIYPSFTSTTASMGVGVRF